MELTWNHPSISIKSVVLLPEAAQPAQRKMESKQADSPCRTIFPVTVWRLHCAVQMMHNLVCRATRRFHTKVSRVLSFAIHKSLAKLFFLGRGGPTMVWSMEGPFCSQDPRHHKLRIPPRPIAGIQTVWECVRSDYSLANHSRNSNDNCPSHSISCHRMPSAVFFLFISSALSQIFSPYPIYKQNGRSVQPARPIMLLLAMVALRPGGRSHDVTRAYISITCLYIIETNIQYLYFDNFW